MKLTQIRWLGVLTCVICGCASGPNSSSYPASGATSPVPAEVLAASGLDRNVVVTVDFESGQDSLPSSAVQKIEKALVDAKAMGTVKSVEVAAWSDQQYPLKGKSLSKNQIKLADRRARVVENIVRSVEKQSEISRYNMAKQPNAFQRWIYTRDVDVKNKLASAGIVAVDSSQMIPSRKSIAMVFIEIE
jgi:hypothetical protein